MIDLGFKEKIYHLNYQRYEYEPTWNQCSRPPRRRQYPAWKQALVIGLEELLKGDIPGWAVLLFFPLFYLAAYTDVRRGIRSITRRQIEND